MKSRSASEWVKAYDTIHQELTVKGFKPRLQTLDNEASPQRRGMSHMDFQRTLCGRALFSRPLLSTAHVGKTLTTGGNHIASPPNLATTPATLCRCPLPRPRGLQQNSLCSARVQNHCTRETRQPTHVGTPRATLIFAGTHHASLLMSKSIHLFQGQCHSYCQPTN
jgi:hypothetical protein